MQEMRTGSMDKDGNAAEEPDIDRDQTAEKRMSVNLNDGKGQSEAEPHAESKPDCGNCDHAPLQDEGKGVDNY